MISEGPKLIEALPGELQNALNGAVPPDEELFIAVRGNQREALAVTGERLLVLREPVVPGLGGVEIREASLDDISSVRAEARPVGGRLTWENRDPAGPTLIEYPTYDAGKYNLVAQRLQTMIQQRRNPSIPGSAPLETAPAAAAGARACPKCQTLIPAHGAWCPKCGLLAWDPCWECGQPLETGADYCAFCGTPATDPAVIECRSCRAAVRRGQVYCTACGTQARAACAECERPMRREWRFCPACGGEPAWTEESSAENEAPAPPRRSEPVAQPARLAEAERFNSAGIEAYEAEDLEQAVRLFRQAAEADPSNAQYHTNLGVALAEHGEVDGAIEAYRRAVALNPRELGAYLNMGVLFNEQERASEAREIWERLIRIAPDSEEAQEARQYLASLDEI